MSLGSVNSLILEHSNFSQGCHVEMREIVKSEIYKVNFNNSRSTLTSIAKDSFGIVSSVSNFFAPFFVQFLLTTLILKLLHKVHNCGFEGNSPIDISVPSGLLMTNCWFNDAISPFLNLTASKTSRDLSKNVVIRDLRGSFSPDSNHCVFDIDVFPIVSVSNIAISGLQQQQEQQQQSQKRQQQQQQQLQQQKQKQLRIPPPSICIRPKSAIVGVLASQF